MSDTLPFTPIEIAEAPPLTRRYWIYDDRVVVYEVADATRATIDAWYALADETTRAWPKGRRFIAIHDFRKGSITPYMRQRARELAQAHHDNRGHSIIVVSDNFLGHLAKTFVRGMERSYQPGIKRMIVTSMEEAHKIVGDILS